MNYYTIQIKYGGSEKPNTEELVDLTPGDVTPIVEQKWVTMVREKLFRTGFQIQTGKGTWEFISPLHIYTAYLIRQDDGKRIK